MGVDPSLGRFAALPSDSVIRLFLNTASYGGVEAAIAVQISYVSATFRTLGLSTSALSYVWLAAPLSMALVTPLVGAWSDKCTSRFGRRRPYIVVGAAMTIASLIAFSNAEALGEKLGDSEEGVHTRGIVIAWAVLVALNISTYAAYSVQRAFLTDLVPAPRLPLGNSCLTTHNGIAKMLGYGLGSVCLVQWLPWSLLGTQLRALFTTAALYLAMTATIMVVSSTEQPWRPEDEDEDDPLGDKASSASGCCTVAKQLNEAVKRLPAPILHAIPPQMMSGFAWYTTSVYASTWLGEEVYGGTPSTDAGLACLGDEDAYTEGVQHASQGFLIMAAITTVWGTLMPVLCRNFGLRSVWGFHLLFLAALLLLTPFVKEGQRVFGEALLGLLGFPLAATVQIPWSVVTAAARRAGYEEQRGVLTAFYTMSESLPSVLGGICVGHIVSAFDDSASVGLFVGGLSALCGAGACYFVEVPQELYGKALAEKLPVFSTATPLPTIPSTPMWTENSSNASLLG